MPFLGKNPKFERLIHFVPPLIDHLWRPRETGTWKLSAFCICIPFLSSTPSFFMLSLYYKIAEYPWWHASSNHSGADSTVTPTDYQMFIPWVSFGNRTCSPAGLHSAQGWKTAEHDRSAEYDQLCWRHGQIRPKAGGQVFSFTPALSIAVAVQVHLFYRPWRVVSFLFPTPFFF